MVRSFLVLALASVVWSVAAHADGANEQLRREVAARGWILYSARSAAGDWDLFACRPDGSGVRNLTRTPATSEFYPRLSADGSKLLFRRVPKNETIDGNRHGEQGVPMLSRADGSNARPMGEDGALPWASWSPDGKQLATLAPKGIAIVDVATLKTLRTLPRHGFFQQMTWSPDGEKLLGVANSFGTSWSVATLDLNTGKAAAVNREDCCTPDWAPGGKTVIFSWRPPGQKANGGQGWTQLWLANADGTARRLLFAEDGRHIYGGAVSPDGRYALFTGNVEEDGDPGNAGAPMQIMRLAEAPIIKGKSPEPRGKFPKANEGPLLTLPTGWEPLWTAKEIFR